MLESLLVVPHMVFGMSTVDYLLVHNTDLTTIFKFEVLPVNEFSDHAPLLVCFLTPKTFSVSNQNDISDIITRGKYIWTKQKNLYS